MKSLIFLNLESDVSTALTFHFAEPEMAIFAWGSYTG